MPTLKQILTPITFATALTACGTPGDGDPVYNEGRQSLRADVERQVIDELPADVAEIKRGNIELTLGLLNQAKKAAQNQMLSAYSIRTAFALVYGGARGTTATELNDVLKFNLEGDAFHTAMNAVDQALETRNLDATDELEAVQLRTANTFWGRDSINWSNDYLELLGRHYGAGVEAIDFGADPEAARQEINRWVEEQTETRIKDLLPRNSVKETTAAVLTNAVYFKAPWAHKFEEEMTQERPFKRLDGTSVDIDTMHQRTTGGYARGEGWFAVEKPYRGGELSMLFFVPDEGSFEAFEDTLNHDQLDDIIGALEPTEIALAVPKFKFETTINLKKPLLEMGLNILFNDRADLSGMTQDANLKVSAAFHKTFIAVDEGGAEAAAATAIVAEPTAAIEPPATPARIDRPFVFAIRDNQMVYFSSTGVWSTQTYGQRYIRPTH